MWWKDKTDLFASVALFGGDGASSPGGGQGGGEGSGGDAVLEVPKSLLVKSISFKPNNHHHKFKNNARLTHD